MNIVQVGANIGNDKVYEFIRNEHKKINKAILIEPIPFIIEDLRHSYSDFANIVHIENIAIVDDSRQKLTMFYEENSNYEVSSYNKLHLINHGCPEYKIKEIEVPCMTIDSLLERYKLYELDYLFIDAEGLDVHIVASIDFSKFKISNIVFEIAHTDGVRTKSDNYNQIVRYLQQLRYKLSNYDDLNIQATL